MACEAMFATEVNKYIRGWPSPTPAVRLSLPVRLLCLSSWPSRTVFITVKHYTGFGLFFDIFDHFRKGPTGSLNILTRNIRQANVLTGK
jgi:hypothetical protein